MSGVAPVGFEPAIAADAEALVAIRIAAVRESLERLGCFGALRARDRSNRFYERHGFALVACGEWDNFYERPARH